MTNTTGRASFLAGKLAVFISLLLMAGTIRANDLTLAINLGLPQKEAAERYKSVVAYLSEATGERIQLKLSANSFAHWQKMRSGGYDLVIDNPALTAYRAAKMKYTVVGKLPDVLSFSLVTHIDEMVLEPDELFGRGVASPPSPSIAALRLEEIYPNPARQPRFIQVNHYDEASDMVKSGRAMGAIIPTGLVGGYEDLNTVHTSEQVPAPGISVSARVRPELRETIRQALLEAHMNEAGRNMLEALNVPRIEEATNATYAGIERLLEGMFGY